MTELTFFHCCKNGVAPAHGSGSFALIAATAPKIFAQKCYLQIFKLMFV